MKEIASALVRAQKEFGPALKTSTNPHFRSQYADLSACIEAVIDGLNNNGIFLMQLNEERDGGVCVQTIFIHESGEQLSAGSLFVPAAKHDPQGYGSALTYARRYSLMAACGIAPEDDDANSSSKRKEQSNVASAVPSRPVPKPVVAAKPVEAPQVVSAPKKMEGASGQWQLKVSAEPGTDTADWSSTILQAAMFALEMAQTEEDVTSIFKINRVIFDKLKAIDTASYDTLLNKFKEFKEKLHGQ